MQQRLFTATSISITLATLCASAGIALACSAGMPDQALAVTAAEKRAEADSVYEQIDSLQTNLNKAMAEYERAQSAYEAAIQKRDAATQSIEEETARYESLQGDLSQFAVGMYKTGGATRFLDVMLDATTFDRFLTSWDACNALFAQGESALSESREAREALEASQAQYQKQSEKAESEMDAATAAQAEIEQTQAALREQAEQLSAEAAELQREEELAAEAARQAEEARQRREAELAAAAEAAEQARIAEEEAQAQAQEEDADDEEGEEGEDDFEDVPEASQPSDPVVIGAGYFTNPCPSATSSSGFGYRSFDNSFHKGLDMAAPEGTPYYAADSGTVMYATNDGGYNGGAGNWVVISHGNGVVTKYMHSSATYVSPGDYVERGQNIGAVGNTGQSFGAHLHFQVEIDGVAVNPLNYI